MPLNHELVALGARLRAPAHTAPVYRLYALPDGRRFHDVDEFKQLIAADPDRIAGCLAEKLIVYATGSGISYADRRAVNEIVKSVRPRNFGLRSLVHAVVQSPVFLNK